MIASVEDFICGLKNKNDEIKSKVAREFKNFIVNDLKDKNHEEMISCVDSMFYEFLRLMNSNELQDKKAVLIGICCIADTDIIFSHNSFIDLTKQIIDMPVYNDVQINSLRARFIAELNLISTNDRVESQIKDSCSVVVDDNKSEAQKIYAALTFKEHSLYASTVFFQHANKVINSLLIGIRDKQASVREACAQALAYSFSVIATREGIGRRRSKVKHTTECNNGTMLSSHRLVSTNQLSISQQKGQQLPANTRLNTSLDVNQIMDNNSPIGSGSNTSINKSNQYLEITEWGETLFGECVKSILRTANDSGYSSHITSRKLTVDSWNHGTLLLLIELLKLANDDMETNLLKLEEMIGLKLEQLASPTSLPTNVTNLRTMSYNNMWPLSNSEQHILQHRSRIYHSYSCRILMLKEMEKIWPIVMQNFETKHSHLTQLTMLVLPRLIALNPSSTLFNNQHLQSLEWLQKCVKKDKERPLSFITIGLVAHVIPDTFESTGHLEKTIQIVKTNIPNKDVPTKKRQPMLEMSVYMLVGLIATGCRHKVHDHIKDMIHSMVDAGLSFPLIYSLKMVSCFISELTNDIQTTLLKCLRKILMFSSRQRMTQSNVLSLDTDIQLASAVLSPISPANLSPDQLDARNKILALRTLVEFDFDKHNLSIFVRFISSKLITFVHCPYKELRIEAVKTCAQLLTPLLGNDDTISASDRNTLNAVAEVLEKLLIVSTSDPEPEVRLCVFQSFDERFDAYLAQECHLSSLFIALHDESFEIRKLVIRCLGRLSAINPSCLKPNLRKILLQTLNELENSGSSRCKEHAAQLLSELIDTAPGFIQPHSEQLLLVLLPRIQSIIDAAKLQNKEDINANDNNESDFSITRGIRDNIWSKPSRTKLLSSNGSMPLYRVDNHIEPSGVQLAVMEAIKNLAVVCGSKLRRHLDELVPALIYMMQDSTTLHRRHVAVCTLCGLVTHTGYVVQPYKRHPELLRILLNMLQTEEVGSIRREVIKLLGTIGALDPFKLKLFSSDVDSAGDIGLVVSMHEVVEKKEVDMTQAELLVNIPWASMEDFFIACTLQSLIQLLREPSFRTYFDKICYSIMIIFKSLGAKSVQYLRQILPEYFRCITDAPDNRQQEILLVQICLITDVVKLHLKQFMPQLVDILLQLWGKSDSLTKICIIVLQKLNQALGPEIKPFINRLIVVFQHSLSEESEQSIVRMLDFIPEFGCSIEENFHILIPSIMKLLSRDDGGARLEVKQSALDCLTRLAEKLDLSNMAGRIVQPVCRMLYRHENSNTTTGNNSNSLTNLVTSSTTSASNIVNTNSGLITSSSALSMISTTTNILTIDQLGKLVPNAFDLLTTLLVQMRCRFMVLAPLTQKTVESIKGFFPPGSIPSQSIVRFNTILNKVVKVYYVSYHDDDFSEYESQASRRRLDQSSSGAINSIDATLSIETGSDSMSTTTNTTTNTTSNKFNSLQLESAWSHTENLVSSEDWLQWLRNFSHALIRQSPCQAIRACATNIGGCTAATPTLGRQLFNAAFVSCWPQLTDAQQDKLVATLERVLNQDCSNTEVTQALLNLEEFMSRCDRMKLPISTRILATRALNNRVYAKALYYKEQEFLEEKAKKGGAPQKILFELLSINHKLQLEEAASGVVIYATKVHKDKLIQEELWYERLGDWTRALNLYERKLEELESRRLPNNDFILGRMRCLQALGDWNTLKSIGLERFDQIMSDQDPTIYPPLSQDNQFKMAPILVNAAWALGDFQNMAKFVEAIPSSGTFNGPFYRAVISIHYENFHEAADFIQRAREELDSYLTAMAGESYIRAYNDLVQAQKLAELEEVMQYKLVRESQPTIRRAWTERLAGCHQNIDDWRQLLQIRSLVLTPQQDVTSWLKMAGLARRSGRMELSRTVIEALRSSCTTDPRIEFAWAKYQWAVNQNNLALKGLYGLVYDDSRRTQDNQQQSSRLLLAKCCLRLGQWYTEICMRESDMLQNSTSSRSTFAGLMSSGCDPISMANQYQSSSGSSTQNNQMLQESQSRIICAYRLATEEAPWLPRAWQAWAMANYVNICRAKSQLIEINKEMNFTAKRWFSIRKRVAESNNNSANVTTNFYQQQQQQQPSLIPSSINTNSNTSNSQLPPEVLRMAQPQLRFSLLQAHQKKGYSLVSFPSMAPHIPDSLSTFGQAVAVRPPNQHSSNQIPVTPANYDDQQIHQNNWSNPIPEDMQKLAYHYNNLEKTRLRLIHQRDVHSHPAVRGFVNAISLSQEANLQDSLRLVILLFQFGHSPKIRDVICDGLSKIRLENWLLVIQQLLARIDTQKEHVASIIVGLLISVGERHPQAMINPLVLSFKSGGSDRRRYNANKILHSMETHSPKLVAEGFLLNEELIRLAISWMEMWTECLEDASRLFYEDKNVIAMFKILHPLHLLMERKVETLQESVFYNEYAQDLFGAKNLCVRYESSNYKTDLTQAWEIYSNLYRKWSKQISNFSTIELSVASPRLHDYRSWTLAIPGSYEPSRPSVPIRSVRNCLHMMTSKQHPRKLTLVGCDGHNYMFLLKGHEDIRQDERAMQFFGLINTLLVTNPLTFRRNLSIQRMSVIPLSTNTGLIGWVPNSDTLNALIREYREKTGVLLNREHKEMLKKAPDFEKLNIIQKTEVFEAGMRESDGKDLAHILWLKSHNSETWFERRTNFIRSLAVMSMVGYILGLGDRHPSNIMLCRQSGKVIHIDFGDCFEVATLREKYPEKVPFRLTRMLIGAMEVTGLDGVFRQTCVQLIRLMRRNHESLLAVLEAFIHDPLLQWVLHDNNNNNNMPTSQSNAPTGTPPGSRNADPSFTQHQLQETIAVNELRKFLNLQIQQRYYQQHHHQDQQQTNESFSSTVNNNNLSGPASSASLYRAPLLSDNYIRIFTDCNYPDSRTLRNPYSVNQWRHHLCNGPWLGSYSTALTMRKRAQDGSIIVERNGLEGLIFSAKPCIQDNSIPDDAEDDWAGANARAMKVMNHIQDKLEGKEAAGGCLSAEKHVDMLIKQATSNYNLCQMYFGWCAFW